MDKTIGKFIKKRRKELKLTQNEISEKLGFKTCQFISNIERGVASIPPNRVEDFAKILQVNVKDLSSVISETFKRKFIKKTTGLTNANYDPFIDEFISAWSVADEEEKNHIKFLLSKVLGLGKN